jgi:hypothetical protein
VSLGEDIKENNKNLVIAACGIFYMWALRTRVHASLEKTKECQRAKRLSTHTKDLLRARIMKK